MRGNLFAIYCVQSDAEALFSLVTSVFPCNHLLHKCSLLTFHSCISDVIKLKISSLRRLYIERPKEEYSLASCMSIEF